MKIFYKEIQSPVGGLRLVADDQALVAVLWEQEREGRVRLGPQEKSEQQPLLQQAEQELQEYFAGQREVFQLPLEATGTPFQKKVWQALREIPFGETRSYAQLAAAIGSPKAARAVGAANGRNPLSILVPCHRVIGRNGKLTGFAGGLETKEILLKMESRSRRA